MQISVVEDDFQFYSLIKNSNSFTNAIKAKY